jgi:hypothetical protein
MRAMTELSGNIRAMARSPNGWGDRIHDGTINGGGNEMLPNALAVLAAAEARFMFYLVKTSGCRPEGDQDEHETCRPTVTGDDSQAER